MGMKILNFHPKGHYFSKIAVLWKGLLLNPCPSRNLNSTPMDLSLENPGELLWDLLGPMSFIEVSRLYNACHEHPHFFQAVDWNSFFQKQKLFWNQRNLELIKKLKTINHGFLSWAQDRQMSPRDLMPLNSLNSMETFNRLGEKFPELGLTRSEGKNILDLLVDLILMGQTAETLMPLSSAKKIKQTRSQNPLQINHNTIPQSKIWCQQLMAKRYPNTWNRDSSTQETKSWPRYAQVKKFRQGDQMIHKLQITYKDESDLDSKLKYLHGMNNHV